jgi:pilus assembly protein CpaE
MVGNNSQKILIVDDDLDTLRLVGMFLQRKGFKILAADLGRTAIVKASQERPDLIILDVMMPDMDGLEVLRRLRAQSATGSIPIIMFTAKSQVDDKLAGFDAGADDYLTKPTHPSELVARVKSVLARTGVRLPTKEDSGPPRDRGAVAAVIGAKGGVGTTAVTINLAAMLHHDLRREVIAVDMRPGQGSLSLSLGLEDRPSIHPLFNRDVAELTAHEVAERVVPHPNGLRVLPASPRPEHALGCQSEEHGTAITQRLWSLYKHIVLDLGAGLTPLSNGIARFADHIIVPFESNLHTIQLTKNLLDALEQVAPDSERITPVLVNRSGSDVHMTLREVQERLGHPVPIVFSPAEDLFDRAQRRKMPAINLQQNSLTNQQFQKLAHLHIRQGRLE